MNLIKRIIVFLPIIMAFFLVTYIIIAPQSFQNNYPQVGQSIISMFLISFGLVIFLIVLFVILAIVKPSSTKHSDDILDNNLDWKLAEPDLATILKNIHLLYPIVFKDKYQEFVDTIKLIKSSPSDYQRITEPLDNSFLHDYDEFNQELEPDFFESYATKNGFMLSFYENEIAEDNQLRIYDFVKEKLNIEIEDIEDVLSDRKHGDGFNITEKQVIKIQEH